SPPPRLPRLPYPPCPPCLCSEWFVAIDQPDFARYVAWRGRQTLLHIKEAPGQAASDSVREDPAPARAPRDDPRRVGRVVLEQPARRGLPQRCRRHLRDSRDHR